MRNQKATLEDLDAATKGYANLTNRWAMLVMRLVADVADYMTMHAHQEAELEMNRAEIKVLRNIAKLAGNLTERLAVVNIASSYARSLDTAMQYGKETALLAEALTEVGE